MSSFKGSVLSSRLKLVLCLIIASSASGLSRAEEATPSNESSLKGEVKQVEISLSRIRDVSLDVQRVKADVKALYGEATRQLVNIDSSPTIIGSTVVNIPYSFKTGEYMQPRKKWVSHYTSQIGPTLKLLKEGVDEMESGCRSLLVPAGIKNDFQQAIESWNYQVKETNKHFDDLNAYVEQGRLTNKELGDKTLILGNDMRNLDATLKIAFKLVKTSTKKNKNDKLVPIAEQPSRSGWL